MKIDLINGVVLFSPVIVAGDILRVFRFILGVFQPIVMAAPVPGIFHMQQPCFPTLFFDPCHGTVGAQAVVIRIMVVIPECPETGIAPRRNDYYQ